LAAALYIGTSGWNYDHWQESFYAGVKRKDWLRFYSKQFNAVEVNATFYRLQDRKTFTRWQEETPADFRFTIKGNRYLTHNRKLHDPVDSIRLERERAAALGKKLAAVLWQLPGTYHKHMDRLRTFAWALSSWSEVRHVIEFRHRSWFDDEVADCLAEHDIASCQSDAADWPLWDAVTTNLAYVRLHGHTRTYASAYRKSTLEQWAGKIEIWLAEGRQVHVYFDNDAEGHAPRDARRLRQLISQPALP
jgi:uncharacterized protein YecE (DUF72 family)